jgi:hypothetical protein
VGRRLRTRAGIAAIVALAIGWALVIHATGWAQLSTYAQVRALADGHPQIDRWHWETKDKAWVDGHFYSVKAPGLAVATLPAYLALHAAGAERVAADAVENVRGVDHQRWRPYAEPPYPEDGFSPVRAARVNDRIQLETPIVWALTLIGAVVPAVLMLLLVRSLGDRLEPGFGAAAALTLGLATILMTFASEYFPHVGAAALGFAAFATLYRERRGPPRTALVGAAGLLAGLAVSFEYPLALVGVVLFAYAISGSRPRIPRVASYAAGAVIGAAPVLAFNQWAFGSPLQFAYADAVSVQGLTGHEVLGLNDGGFFGISAPRPGAALDLLLSGRGLLAITPVVAMGIAGALAMRRRSHRAEANVILAVAAVYFLYNAGYWLPFGGGSPGPRFLIPALPFVALGIATAWRRWPAHTLVLAAPSAVFMLAAALTHPLIGDEGTATWAQRLADGELEHTLLTALGVHDAWLGVLPVLAAVGLAVALGVAATPRLQVGGLRAPLGLLIAWAAAAAVGPTIAGDAATPLSGGDGTLVLIAAGAVAAALSLAVLRYRERRSESAVPAIAVPALARNEALGERIS